MYSAVIRLKRKDKWKIKKDVSAKPYFNIFQKFEKYVNYWLYILKNANFWGPRVKGVDCRVINNFWGGGVKKFNISDQDFCKQFFSTLFLKFPILQTLWSKGKGYFPLKLDNELRKSLYNCKNLRYWIPSIFKSFFGH